MNDKERSLREVNNTMDFLWQPKFEGVNGTFQTNGGLYTHMMPTNYNTPCWVPLTYFWNPTEQLSNRNEFIGKITNNLTIYDEWI